MQLSESITKFDELGVIVAAISYDSVATNNKFSKRSSIAFPILSDDGASHVKRFGILNENYEPGHRAYGIPHPGIFVVDSEGKVVQKLAETNYRDRPPLELILDAASELD